LNKRKMDVETKKAESQGKAMVAVLDRELESIDAELQRQTELVVQKNKEAACHHGEVRRGQAALARIERQQGQSRRRTTKRPRRPHRPSRRHLQTAPQLRCPAQRRSSARFAPDEGRLRAVPFDFCDSQAVIVQPVRRGLR
jgi:hypothetical protein